MWTLAVPRITVGDKPKCFFDKFQFSIFRRIPIHKTFGCHQDDDITVEGNQSQFNILRQRSWLFPSKQEITRVGLEHPPMCMPRITFIKFKKKKLINIRINFVSKCSNSLFVPVIGRDAAPWTLFHLAYKTVVCRASHNGYDSVHSGYCFRYSSQTWCFGFSSDVFQNITDIRWHEGNYSFTSSNTGK